MKAGDRCWVPVTVAETWYMGDRFMAAESVWHASEALPDHPALASVAAWLQTHPDAAATIARCLASHHATASKFPDLAAVADVDLALLGALLTALETEGAK